MAMTYPPGKTAPTLPPPPPKPGKEVSAMGWIEDAFGKVLMVKQRRGRKLWTLPGGKVRAREALADALVREILEETGLKARSVTACDFYDRHEKANLTILFRVTLREGITKILHDEEIEAIAFRASPPKNSTPSLLFFWDRQRRADISKSKA